MSVPADRITISVAPMEKCALANPRWWAGEVRRGAQVLVAGGNVADASAAKHEKPNMQSPNPGISIERFTPWISATSLTQWSGDIL